MRSRKAFTLLSGIRTSSTPSSEPAPLKSPPGSRRLASRRGSDPPGRFGQNPSDRALPRPPSLTCPRRGREPSPAAGSTGDAASPTGARGGRPGPRPAGSLAAPRPRTLRARRGGRSTRVGPAASGAGSGRFSSTRRAATSTTSPHTSPRRPGGTSTRGPPRALRARRRSRDRDRRRGKRRPGRSRRAGGGRSVGTAAEASRSAVDATPTAGDGKGGQDGFRVRGSPRNVAPTAGFRQGWERRGKATTSTEVAAGGLRGI